jgi:hypothetical protein
MSIMRTTASQERQLTPLSRVHRVRGKPGDLYDLIFLDQHNRIIVPVLATWIIRSKTSPTKPGKISFPACKQGWVGVPSDVITSILLLERYYAHVMEKLFLWLVF